MTANNRKEAMSNVDNIISNRAGSHGIFTETADVTQYFKELMRARPGWANLSPVQRESMDMIVTNMSRVLSGDPNFAEHWEKIETYAHLSFIELRSSGA